MNRRRSVKPPVPTDADRRHHSGEQRDDVHTWSAEPLHFGDCGGLPLKLLWTACNLLTLFIVGNGAWLFFDRRRSRTLAREYAS